MDTIEINIADSDVIEINIADSDVVEVGVVEVLQVGNQNDRYPYIHPFIQA